MNWLLRKLGWGNRTGGLGEEAACGFFRGRGAEILARNFRCRMGEIDLIVREGGFVVFVEVKTASADARGAAPEERVNPSKRRKLVRLAEYYLRWKGLEGRPVRLDVLSVRLGPDGKPAEVRHYPDAFGADG
jgi:putative endonuclease